MLKLVKFTAPDEVEEFRPGEKKVLSIGKYYEFEIPPIKDINIIKGPSLEISDTGVFKFGYTVAIDTRGPLTTIPYESYEMYDSYSLDHIKRLLEDGIKGQMDPNCKNRYLDVMYVGTLPLFRIDNVHVGNVNITLDERVKLIEKYKE